MKSKRVGILVGGGPAPGINAVIGAATIEAINNGFEVFGFYDGFKWLASNQFDVPTQAVRLHISDVARIHFDGGSILRTSRTSLMDDEKRKTSPLIEPNEAKVNQVLHHLTLMGITNLITIGGDDTSLSARFVAEASGGALRLIHVPKTIDNDLPLPADIDTFGFSTARYVGTGIVKNLMQDSRTTGRWYVVVAMGRTAGWLSLGIGRSAGATLTLLPEEFPEKTTFQSVTDVIEGSMLKRQVMGRRDGVVVVAEGVTYKLGDREEIEKLLGRPVAVDVAGHMRLAEVPMAEMLRTELQQRFQNRGERISIVNHTLGYELRSADPTPGDMAYCRSLGHGAIRLLLKDGAVLPEGSMVTIANGELAPIGLRSMLNPETNRTETRTVDLRSYSYQVARAYMIRLERQDLEDPAKLALLANEAKMKPGEFRTRYAKAAACPFEGYDIPIDCLGELAENA